jgi:hypothetical protein
MEDYYALVGIDRSASREAIDRAIRKQLRLWQRRAASVDLVGRHEAERMVWRLGEARMVLLDDQQRVRYDARLDALRAPPRPAPPPAPHRPAPADRPPVPPLAPPAPMPAPPAPPGPPGQVPGGPVPAPPPPLPRGGFHATLEYRYAPGQKFTGLAGLICMVVFVIVEIVGGFGVLGGAPFWAIFIAVGLLGMLFDKRGDRVVLNRDGVTAYDDGIEHIPWAQVEAIDETDVDGVPRVVVRTVGGRDRLLPAPRGRGMTGGDFHFAGKLAKLRRWHAHYRPPPGTGRR